MLHKKRRCGLWLVLLKKLGPNFCQKSHVARVAAESVFTTRSGTSCTCILYGMHAERWHAVWNACRKMACCTECMLKDAKGLHSVQNAKFYCAEGVKLNSPLMVDLL